MNKNLEVLGTELTTEEFLEEYNNRSEQDDSTVEMIDPETNEVVTLSEEEFKNMIADEDKTI